MITFPLREAMCSGVMPFWKGEEQEPVRLRCPPLQGSGSAPHAHVPLALWWQQSRKPLSAYW